MDSDIEMTSGYAPVESGELYYEVVGEGPSVLFLHAGVADHSMWEPQIEPFSRGHKVITYDLRGFGVSRSEDASFSNSQDMRDLLAHLGVEKATVVGNSRGGRIAVDFALNYPEMTSAVVWICGGLGGMEDEGSEEETEAFGKAEALWEAKDWAALADMEAHIWGNGIGQREDRAPAHVREKLRDMIYSNYTREGAEGQARPLDPPAIERLDEITVPGLLLIGDLDTIATRKGGEILAQGLKDVEVHHFADVAHMVSMEKPEEFNEIVLDFLARHDI